MIFDELANEIQRTCNRTAKELIEDGWVVFWSCVNGHSAEGEGNGKCPECGGSSRVGAYKP